MPVNRLSYSSISTYLLCPRSWRFRYIEKPVVPVSVALPFGSAIHSAVQTYISAKTLYPDQVRPLAELWITCWQDALDERREKGQEVKWDRPYDQYTRLGESMLAADDVVFAVDSIVPMARHDGTDLAEHFVEFRVPGVPIPVVGYIDMIAADGVPIDFKTASRKWSKGKEHSEIQANFYLLALNQEEHTLNPSNKFRYVIFTKTKTPTCQVLETSRSWGELFWTMTLIHEVWKAIEGGHFPPNSTSWKCSDRWCEYWELCRR